MLVCPTKKNKISSGGRMSNLYKVCEVVEGSESSLQILLQEEIHFHIHIQYHCLLINLKND